MALFCKIIKRVAVNIWFYFKFIIKFQCWLCKFCKFIIHQYEYERNTVETDEIKTHTQFMYTVYEAVGCIWNY